MCDTHESMSSHSLSVSCVSATEKIPTLDASAHQEVTTSRRRRQSVCLSVLLGCARRPPEHRSESDYSDSQVDCHSCYGLSSYTTVGYRDVVLPISSRLLGPIEAEQRRRHTNETWTGKESRVRRAIAFKQQGKYVEASADCESAWRADGQLASTLQIPTIIYPVSRQKD